MYATFREEEMLVGRHILEILYYLVESLALADADDGLCGTRDLCKAALDHVERIVCAKSALLNERHSDRVRPPGTLSYSHGQYMANFLQVHSTSYCSASFN
jgi:hypothetical protein